MKDLIAVGSLVRVHSNQPLQHLVQFLRVMRRYLRIKSFKNFLEKAIHILGSKRRLLSNDLVEDATQRPDITLAVVRLVLPDFWTRIVRCASLGVKQTSCALGNFGDVQVAKLHCKVPRTICSSTFIQEYVGTLHISVKDSKLM